MRGEIRVWVALTLGGRRHMRAGVPGARGGEPARGHSRELRRPRAGAIQWPTGGVVTAETLGTAPDGVLATEVAPHQDVQPRTAPPPRLLQERQGEALFAIPSGLWLTSALHFFSTHSIAR